MYIRPATQADMAQVFKLCAEGYEETRYGRYPLRIEKFQRLWDLMQEYPDAFVCVVALDGDSIVGILLGSVTDHFWADMRYATNLALYVAPTHRGRGLAPRLIREFERGAFAAGADEVQLGVSSDIDPDHTMKLYNALDYKTVGGLCVKYKE